MAHADNGPDTVGGDCLKYNINRETCEQPHSNRRMYSTFPSLHTIPTTPHSTHYSPLHQTLPTTPHSTHYSPLHQTLPTPHFTKLHWTPHLPTASHKWSVCHLPIIDILVRFLLTMPHVGSCVKHILFFFSFLQVLSNARAIINNFLT